MVNFLLPHRLFCDDVLRNFEPIFPNRPIVPNDSLNELCDDEYCCIEYIGLRRGVIPELAFSKPANGDP